jgi:predicted nucleic acid-binding Zn ribbon protein
MAKSSNETTIKEALDALLKYYGLTEKFKENRAVEIWEKVMGSFIAKKTTDIKVRNRKLYVQLLSPALRNELQYEKEKIRLLMNAEIGEDFFQEVILG